MHSLDDLADRVGSLTYAGPAVAHQTITRPPPDRTNDARRHDADESYRFATKGNI
ncbi:hypothetical protein [Prescottella equi]